MAHNPRDRHVEAIIDAFLQNRSTEQSQDYVARGRRFSGFDVKQLNQDWIMATRSWLARKAQTIEQRMDDLASELRLRGLQPPYDAVKQELNDCSASTTYAERRQAQAELARRIDEFVRHRKPALN
jgi:hypothetical protein